MQTAVRKGTVTTDIYQTQLAIWRATTGAYQDFAGQGTALAQEIYDEAQSATIPPAPSDAVLVDEAVRAGTLTATIEDFRDPGAWHSRDTLPWLGEPGDRKCIHTKRQAVLLEGAV